MPGGNWASMPVVERLESELGKPVLVNNAVSLWAGLRLLKRGDSIPGYGRLLRDHLRDELCRPDAANLALVGGGAPGPSAE